MSNLTEELKTIGIFNPHTLVAIGHPIITLRKCGRGLSAAWLLSVKGRWFQDVPWYDNGSLSFSKLGTEYKTMREAVARPLAKCKELFPDMEMVKGPWLNTYVPNRHLEDCDWDDPGHDPAWPRSS